MGHRRHLPRVVDFEDEPSMRMMVTVVLLLLLLLWGWRIEHPSLGVVAVAVAVLARHRLVCRYQPVLHRLP